MATPESKQFAKQLVTEHLKGTGYGHYWPKVKEEEVASGLIDRVDRPDIVFQSAANVCGMASFVHDLLETDPVLYTWLGIHLFKSAKGRLGRGQESIVITASVETRSSPLPAGINHADWVVLASLRDYSNKVLKYGYNTKIPVLSDIPILGIFGQSWVAEPIAGINWPKDLEVLLRAAGFRRIVNAADTLSLAGYKNFERAGEYYEAGYQVMLLISNSMLTGGKPTPTAEHWITLESKIEENIFAFQGSEQPSGVAFTIFNPAKRAKYKVPSPPAAYIPLRQVLNNFYGFVAARAT
jgi:hypothetical protein